MPSARLGRYLLEEKVGTGRMGTVFRARAPAGQRVAVKILAAERLADADMRSRFRQEARILAALSHPNIAAFCDFGEDRLEIAGEPARPALYLVTEWVTGQDLSQLLTDGPLEPRAAVRLAHQIALALEAAHRRGVIHRDLKPGNIRLAVDGRVKVLDFGLAKVLEHAELGKRHRRTYQTSIGSLLGSAPYMAPEQLSGRPVDPRADLFALGVVLYQLLSGALPFAGDHIAGILEALAGPQLPPPLTEGNPDIAAELESVVFRLLEKDPDRRFSSAAAALLALQVLV